MFVHQNILLQVIPSLLISSRYESIFIGMPLFSPSYNLSQIIFVLSELYMHQNMNDFSESDTPFSFQQLLYGDDWQRWDTYPSVDVNAYSIEPNHSMVEMNHDGLTIEPNPISMIYPMVIIYFLHVFLRDIKVWMNNIRLIENV